MKGSMIMKTTIIVSNPSENSFSKSIMDKAIDGLNKKQKSYEVIDLYKDKFNPVMSDKEVKLYTEENNRPKGLLNNIKSGLCITTSESDTDYIKNELVCAYLNIKKYKEI